MDNSAVYKNTMCNVPAVHACVRLQDHMDYSYGYMTKRIIVLQHNVIIYVFIVAETLHYVSNVLTHIWLVWYKNCGCTAVLSCCCC